jgi:uncharacterized membrane protein
MITAPHLHAILIHFPIALLVIGFLSELLAVFSKRRFYENVSFYLLSIGTLGTVAAYLSGSYAGDGMTDGIFQVPLGMHKEAALVTLSLSILTLLSKATIYFFNYQKTWSKWANFLLFALLIGSVTRTAYLGGELVFKHGAGIELTLPDFGEKPLE